MVGFNCKRVGMSPGDVHVNNFSGLVCVISSRFMKIVVKIILRRLRFIGVECSRGYERIMFCLYDLSPAGVTVN